MLRRLKFLQMQLFTFEKPKEIFYHRAGPLAIFYLLSKRSLSNMPNIKPISDRLEIKTYNDVGSHGKITEHFTRPADQ